MENATDALKIAFVAFIFIVALSIVFSLMTKIKATADSILISSDQTTYYNWNTGETNYRQRNGRVVGVDEVISTSFLPLTNETININKLLDVMESSKPMTATEIMKKLGIKSKETLRGQYLDPAIRKGLVSLTIPDKPTSRNQMYYKN